jgi:hypothetical protein
VWSGAGAYLLIPADGPRTRGRRFDLPGAVLATAGMSLLDFALIQGPETGWIAVNPQSPSRRWYEARWLRPSAMEQMSCSTALPGR